MSKTTTDLSDRIDNVWTELESTGDSIEDIRVEIQDLEDRLTVLEEESEEKDDDADSDCDCDDCIAERAAKSTSKDKAFLAVVERANRIRAAGVVLANPGVWSLATPAGTSLIRSARTVIETTLLDF